MASENALFPVENLQNSYRKAKNEIISIDIRSHGMWKKEISYWTVKTEWKPATVWKVTKCGAVKWLSHRDMPALHIRMK